MAYAIQVNIADQWECGEWITPERNGITGDRVPSYHWSRAAAETALAELLADMAEQGMENDPDSWRVAAVAVTLEQFRASGFDCDDIGAELDDVSLMGVPGRIYLGVLYIEKWQGGSAPWFTTIENTQPAGTLEQVETVLYDWATRAGYCGDDDASDDASDDAAAECARNGHTDTGRGVCADCGEFL
jgi:hypothetical protein